MQQDPSPEKSATDHSALETQLTWWVLYLRRALASISFMFPISLR